MAQTVFHLEIGPLKETQYTGISEVTAALAAEMLGEEGRRTAFFYGRVAIEREIVADLVLRRNGELLPWYLQRSGTRPAPAALPGLNVAIFPNRKSCRRGFDVECQIVHDLSTFLTPQFHNDDTIEFHTSSLLEDVHSNDLTFCVSQATREDVLRYLGPLDPERVVAIPLAAATQEEDPALFAGRKAEPYVLVLGTIEPRKNAAIVFEALARNPALLRRLKFVFLGRHGWGEKFDALLARYGLSEDYEKGRILFPGFVGEGAKRALLSHARLLLYPSLFEGFGLPVVEALSFGVPVVTTRSSSLPEVAGEASFYFDPFCEGDFDRVLARALSELRVRGQALRRRSLARAAEFSWSGTYRRMMAAIEAVLPQQGQA